MYNQHLRLKVNKLNFIKIGTFMTSFYKNFTAETFLSLAIFGLKGVMQNKSNGKAKVDRN